MDFIHGRVPTKAMLKQAREDALKEARDEPGFQLRIFNEEFPPVVDSSDEAEVKMKLTSIFQMFYILTSKF